MKKIKRIAQIKKEKKRLLQRQAELEKAIKYDWLDLKNSLRPKKVGERILSKVLSRNEEKNGNDFLAEGLSQLAAHFTRIAVEKAEEKISKVFRN